MTIAPLFPKEITYLPDAAFADMLNIPFIVPANASRFDDGSAVDVPPAEQQEFIESLPDDML